MRKPIAAALGILALVAASMLAIARWTEPASSPAGRATQPPPEPEPSTERPPGKSAVPPADGPRPAAAGETRERPAAPPADRAETAWGAEPGATTGPWETIAPVNSFGTLGKMGPALRAALYAQSDDVLASCSGGGNELEPQPEEEGVVQPDETPVLLLQLETLPAAVQIAGATVERRGRASQQLLGCALAGLRGAVLAVPEARSGARYVLRFRLAPTSTQRPIR